MTRFTALLVAFAAAVVLQHCGGASGQATSTNGDAYNCADLSVYAEDMDKLEQFVAGGAQPTDNAVFFTVPSQGTPYDYCLQDIPVPTAIGDVRCDDLQKCFVVVGKHAANGAKVSDYQCTCQGSAFDNLTQPPYVDACGISNVDMWSVHCPDLYNRRRFFDTNSSTEMGSVTLSVSSCVSATGSGCAYCNGGTQPAVKVGLQWITDSIEQCLEDPFSSGSTVFLTASSIATAVTVFLCSLVYLGCSFL